MDCNNFFTTDALGFDSNLDSLIQADYDEEIALPFSSHSQMSAHMNDGVDLSVSEGLGIVDSSSEMKVNPEEVAEMGCDDLDGIPSDILNMNPVKQESSAVKSPKDICQSNSNILTAKSDRMDSKLTGITEINTENLETKQQEDLEIDFNELNEMPSDVINIYQSSDKNPPVNKEFHRSRVNPKEIGQEDNENVKKIEQSEIIDEQVNEIDKVYNTDQKIDPKVVMHPDCKTRQTDMVNTNSIPGKKLHLTTASHDIEIKDKISTDNHKQKHLGNNSERTKAVNSEKIKEKDIITNFNKTEGLDRENIKEKREIKHAENINKTDCYLKDRNLLSLENQLDRPKKRKHNDLNSFQNRNPEEDLNCKKIKINEGELRNEEKDVVKNNEININTVTKQSLDSNKEVDVDKLYEKTNDTESESSLDTDSNSQFMVMEEYADEELIAANSDGEDLDEKEQFVTESDRESLAESKNIGDSDGESLVENELAGTESDRESIAEKDVSWSKKEVFSKKEHVATESDRESLVEKKNVAAESDADSLVDNSEETTEVLETLESDGDSVVENADDTTEVLEAQDSAGDSATEGQESAGESASEEIDEDEDTLVEDDFEDMEDFEVIDADDGDDDDEADEVVDVDEKGENNADDDDDDVMDEDELDAWLEEGVDKQDKNHSKGPGLVQSTDELGNGNYVMRTKHVLKEKGKNPFEFLPEGWVAITHNSGMPVYLHRKTRVCTLAKPYFIGKSSARKHETPVSAIPCLQYRKELEKESQAELEKENQATVESNTAEVQNNLTEQAKSTGTQNQTPAAAQTLPSEAAKDIPTPVVATAQGSERMIGVEDLHEYCKNIFEFQDITVKQFRTWEEKRSHMRRRYEKSKILLPKMCGDTKLIVCPIPGTSSKRLSKKRKEFIMNPLNKSPICVLHEYTQHIIKIQPKYTFSEIDNQETPYKATITIDGIVYGTGLGSCKKKAKADAAKKALDVFIPQLSEFWKGADNKGTTEDLSYFEEVAIEDPRVMHLCDKTALPKPFQILNECLKRNFGLGDTTLKMDKKLIANQKTEFILTVGKHTVSVHCKNKKEGRQLASQAMLQKLHPHLKSWASILKLYSKSTELGFQDREEELPQISSGKNFELLEKLKGAMRKTRLNKGLCNASNFVQSQNGGQKLDL